METLTASFVGKSLVAGGEYPDVSINLLNSISFVIGMGVKLKVLPQFELHAGICMFILSTSKKNERLREGWYGESV